jgi:hypothetical protein
MDRLIGLAAIAMGLFMIWNRDYMAEENLRFNNRRLAFFRSKRRYGQREFRHNLRAAWIVGVFTILLGLWLLITG